MRSTDTAEYEGHQHASTSVCVVLHAGHRDPPRDAQNQCETNTSAGDSMLRQIGRLTAGVHLDGDGSSPVRLNWKTIHIAVVRAQKRGRPIYQTGEHHWRRCNFLVPRACGSISSFGERTFQSHYLLMGEPINMASPKT